MINPQVAMTTCDRPEHSETLPRFEGRNQEGTSFD